MTTLPVETEFETKIYVKFYEHVTEILFCTCLEW
jgi:hypothetical protein